MAGVVLLAGIAGIILTYSAFKGVDPRSLITGIFTDTPPTPLPGASLDIGAPTANQTPITGGRPPGSGGTTPAASRFMGAVRNKFGPQINNIGTVSVRPIAGTSTPSQHSYGNALDIFASPSAMSSIWAWSISVAGTYNVRLVIYNRRQWYSGRVSGYDGENPHTDHVHVDFWPQYCGNPPGHPLPMRQECG